MKIVPNSFPALYEAALRLHLMVRRKSSLDPARALGTQALAEGLLPLDLAALHEQILIADATPNHTARQRSARLKRAGDFFGLAVAAMEVSSKPTSRTTAAHLCRSLAGLSQRCVELSSANLALEIDIAERKVVEASLLDGKARYARSLEKSEELQIQLRKLSRQLLVAQEEERKRISRELHDVVAQALAGINIRLALLKREATLNAKTLMRNITLTQRIVKKSTDIVQQFARDLRPTMLDDLGLIPTLHAYLESFSDRTGIPCHLTAYAEVEALDFCRRTVVFRIAQEALANVARHSQATQVEVCIRKLSRGLCLTIHDNGISFDREHYDPAISKRLGIVGMKERAEMIGGSFEIESSPGEGTTVRAQIPFAKGYGQSSKSTTHPTP